MCCVLFLGVAPLAVGPLSARASDAVPAVRVAATPAAAEVWLEGVWDGRGVSCGRVRRLDGEPVAVLGVLPAQSSAGRQVRLQGRYVTNSPCRETREVFLVMAHP